MLGETFGILSFLNYCKNYEKVSVDKTAHRCGPDGIQTY
jgi:hypothetical protein